MRLILLVALAAVAIGARGATLEYVSPEELDTAIADGITPDLQPILDRLDVLEAFHAVPPPLEPPPEPPLPPIAGDSLYFNSSEPGCDGSNSDYLLCDDFEDGDWYVTNCDVGGPSDPANDGWCGTIYAESQLAQGTAVCNGKGVAGTNCTATTRYKSPPDTEGNMADHDLLGPGVTEVWVRFYLKPLSGYIFGAEKLLTFNDGAPGDGGIKYGNFAWNCAIGSAVPWGSPTMGMSVPEDVCQSPNVSGYTFVAGDWQYIEQQVVLNTPGQPDGVYRAWIDNCGPDGTACSGSPTLRIERTNVKWNRNSLSELIQVLWWENWSNPMSTGELYFDQIIVSKTGPIGFYTGP